MLAPEVCSTMTYGSRNSDSQEQIGSRIVGVPRLVEIRPRGA